MTQTLVVSAHLDDAVLSVGGYLSERPGALVVTMMAGKPSPAIVTQWDTRCGFASSSDAVGTRRREDETALACVRAVPVHLDFLDRQYGVADSSELARAVEDQVAHFAPSIVLGPLGVLHPDHVAVRDAVLAADISVPVWIYGDLPYSETAPDSAEEALRHLRRRGFTLEPVPGVANPSDAKAIALQSYASQMRAPVFDGVARMRERLWQVDP